MTTATTTTPLTQLLAHLRETSVIGSAQSAISWDQETMMPAAGSALRADQLATLSGIVHERSVDPKLGELIAAAEAADPGDDPAQTAALREIHRDYEQKTKLPTDLVREMARTSSLGMDAWKAAREARDFSKFLPALKTTVELNRRKAECLLDESQGHAELYDALLDQFEPHTTSAQVEALFAPLREATVSLLDRIRAATDDFKNTPDASAATAVTDPGEQKAFCRAVLETMGFDFNAGRLDEAAHPFCSGFGPGDTRLTNRYRPDGWLDALSGAMHEGGHGLYEQGLPKSEHFGSPLGEAVSLGIHESQSRMWENQVGRSLAFWHANAEEAKKALGSSLAAFSAEDIFRASNLMKPSFIRVESDELTYNLHIMLRFDLERAMLRGELACEDLPGAWNERFENDFGLPVEHDGVGCLQDVHWSMGAIGYFPTYTLGNLYAAQLWEAIGRDHSDRDERIARGDYAHVLSWTREKIHAHGRRFPATELAERATGEKLSHDALARHLGAKAEAVFGL